MTSAWLRLGTITATCCSLAMPARAADGIEALPTLGADAAAFAPSGWSIEKALDADLDGDGDDDKVIVLLETEPSGDAEAGELERHRSLVLLLRQAEGYTLGGHNGRMLISFGNGGVRGGEGTPELRIERGALVVSQIQGSREFSFWEHRIRWSGKHRRFELIGQDTTESDAATGSSTWESCNFLTRVCVETVTPPQVDSDGRELQSVPKTTRRRLRRAPLLPVELAELD